MPVDPKEVQGRKICVVFVAADSAETEAARLRVLHGRADLDRRGVLTVQHEGGAFVVPSSCRNQILPSDGTEILGDAEYYILCRVSGMDL